MYCFVCVFTFMISVDIRNIQFEEEIRRRSIQGRTQRDSASILDYKYIRSIATALYDIRQRGRIQATECRLTQTPTRSRICGGSQKSVFAVPW